MFHDWEIAYLIRLNPVSARLLNQQLASPQFKDPVEVVSWFGAMQAQDPRAMRWAVAMRTRRPSFKAFERAFNDGKIIRAHLLRCTWQMVSAEDYHWMRELIYRKSLSVMNGWTSALGFKISEKEKETTLSLIGNLLRERHVATEDDINAALLAGGIPKEHLFYSHHIRMAELEGLVCSGPIGPKSTYMLVSERIGENGNIGREEALGRLATKYFQSHGPATLEDFVWWSGLNIGDCRKGVDVCGNAISAVRHQGRTFFIHSDGRTRGFRSGNLLLLPAYDEYLIGYKSRDVVLHPDHAHHAHDKKGIFRHVVAFDGEIVGNWSPYAKEGGFRLFKDGLSIPPAVFEKQVEVYHSALQYRRR